MKYSALIGNPTEHSVSPLLFEWIASRLPDPIEYKHLKVDIPDASQLGSALEAFHKVGFCGVNVTLPYKMDVIPLLDKVDESIANIGAVNTITFGEDGSAGYNTDWFGIYKPLNDVSKDTHKKQAIIFGTGGAARAAIYACLELKVQSIIVLHRSIESDRAKLLMSQFKNQESIHFDIYENINHYINEAGIVINATSAGMVGQDPTPFSLDILDVDKSMSDKIFFDCVFNPVKTQLATHFKTKDMLIIDGLWMMIYQGLLAFTLWTGSDVNDMFKKNELEELHTLLQERIEHA